MEHELTIKSSRSGGQLGLSWSKQTGMRQPSQYLHVSLEDCDLIASCSRIYVYEPNDLLRLFEELASQWKGWAGKKEWSSVEGDFGLSCTSDGLGHVAMRVKLKSGIDKDDWSVPKGCIHIDAGQLEELAFNKKGFLYSKHASQQQTLAADSP